MKLHEIKKFYEKHRDKLVLGLGQWFGINNPWASEFETLDGATSKFRDVLGFATGFSALVCVIMLVYGGYTFITAGGDAEKVEQGNNMITAAIVGMIIVFLARTIILFVFERVIQ